MGRVEDECENGIVVYGGTKREDGGSREGGLRERESKEGRLREVGLREVGLREVGLRGDEIALQAWGRYVGRGKGMGGVVG